MNKRFKGFLIQLVGLVIFMQGFSFVHMYNSTHFVYKVIISLGILAGLEIWHCGIHMMLDYKKEKRSPHEQQQE